jgi:NAD(P)-dependent dehydrogenase (short-subunit alcohol dehydrogenase family)
VSYELDFSGRAALVTGAGRGLGREYALALAARGAAVVVNDIGVALDGSGGDAGPASEVVGEIERAGGKAVADGHSIATQDGATELVSTALAEFGRLDIVVNNAGIIQDKAFHKLSMDKVDPVLDVHLRGAFHVCLAAWPHLREQGYGRIVNTTSTSGLFGNFGQASYAAGKMGVVGLTRVLAIEGARYGIKVNAIAPGAVTRMTPEGLIPDPAALATGQVAPVVTYLAHESCEVTGDVLRASGGHVARVFVGITSGYTNSDLTAEDVRDQLDVIRNTSRFAVPGSATDESLAGPRISTGRVQM